MTYQRSMNLFPDSVIWIDQSTKVEVHNLTSPFKEFISDQCSDQRNGMSSDQIRFVSHGCSQDRSIRIDQSSTTKK